MKKQRESRGRRGNGEGSIYFREDKGLWCSSVTVGWDEKGKQKRRILYAKTREELLSKKRELENSIDLGTYTEPSKMTVTEFLDSWFEIYRTSLRSSTHVRNQGILRNHVIPAIGSIYLNKLTPLKLQHLYNSKLNEGQSPRSVRNMHFILHKAFEQAVRWGYLNRNIADLVELRKPQKKEIKVLSKEQVDNFLEAAKGNWYYPLYVLAFTTGLRQGELLGMKWNDIDLAQGTLAVQRTLKELNGKLLIGEPKSKSSRRTISLPQLAIQTLREHRRVQLERGFIGAEWVFTDTKGGLVRVQNMLKRSFKPLVKKAGSPDIRFHDCRHSHSTLLLMQGVNPKLVQERLGHSSIQITLDTYSHVLPNMQKQVARELDVIFKC